MLGINLLSLAKADVLKYKDKNGAPVVMDAITDAEKLIAVIIQQVSKLNANDIVVILNLLPVSVLSKFPEADQAEIANAIIALPGALANVESQLGILQSNLGK
jgi:hypothetical protein